MKTMKLLTFALLLAVACFGQTAMTTTTLSNAVTDPSPGVPASSLVVLASATNVSANGFLYVDQEVMQVTGAYVSGTTIPVRRGASSTRAMTHAASSPVFVVAPGIQARSGFRNYDQAGTCTRTNEPILPVINTLNGKVYDCQGSRWGRVVTQFVPPTQCTFAPTTLTTTNTYVQVGAGTTFVLNAVSNAAAGTNTLTCNILPPTSFFANRGAVLYDIVSAIGSQVVAPTSLGTSTLAVITFPTPTATTQTASTATPVAAAGGTVTTVGPTTTVNTVTTAGSFLTFRHTYSTPPAINTDLQLFQFTFPFVQSAASAMTLNTPGLWVHYLLVEN